MKINLIAKRSRTYRKTFFAIILTVCALVTLLIGYWFFTFQPRVYQETKVAADLVAQGQEDLWANVVQTSDEVLNKQSDLLFMEQILLLSDSATWLKNPLIILLFLLVIWKLVISLIRKLDQQTKNRKLAEYAY